MTLVLDPARPYQEVCEPPLDDALRTLLRECFSAQRRAAAARAAGDPHGGRTSRAVSPEALAEILASGTRVAGIATEREIASAVPFNVRNVVDVVRDRGVAARRRRLDRVLEGALGAMFASDPPPVMFPSGHWWYPPGTHLGWHTNERFPGWRLYLSYAEQPGESFFRFRDPRTGRVETSLDGRWHVRLFEVSVERPLWHAVASDTHRFSVGWIVRPWSLQDAAVRVAKRVLAPLGG